MLDLSLLNKHQLEAVSANKGPILVVAGAGTGKTRVLTTRIAYLIEYMHLEPNRILAFTFTNKAATEMRNRIMNICHHVFVPWIGTYHATCLKILKEDIDKLGRSTNFTVIDDEDQLAIMHSIYKEEHIMSKDIKPNKALDIIGKIKMNDIDINLINSLDKMKELSIFSFDELGLVKVIVKKYNVKLLASNLLDFDDLLLLTHKLLSQNLSVKEKWQNKFDYILVDEFQDTNLIQFEIMNLLIDPKKPNVFAVGDPDQTIYTWRGAYANIFSDYLNAYKQTKTYVLDTNYRSSKNVLKVANNLIKHNKDRIEKFLVTNNDDGSQAIFYTSDTPQQEATYIARQINELVKNHKYEYKDIVILYRAKYLSRAIEQELINHNIPYYVYGSVKFYQRREIKDLLAYLKLIVNPNDELALKRIINVPTRNIGQATVDKITLYTLKNKIGFMDALIKSTNYEEHIEWAKPAINEFTMLIQNLINQAKDKTIYDVLQMIIKNINYEQYLRTLDSFEERWENIQELFASIKEYENRDNSKNIQNFLNEISLYTSDDNKQLNANASVGMMTIHFAKGTEFKIVFVAGMNEGVFPNIRFNRTTDLEEERRIAYVAITRSMKKLYLTCNLGFSPISSSRLTPSRFINEIGSKNYKEEKAEFTSISKADLDWYNSNKNIDYSNNYNKEDIQFKIGDVIVHTTFGSGVVVAINGDMLDVVFKAPWGVKSLVKNHKAIKRMKN